MSQNDLVQTHMYMFGRRKRQKYIDLIHWVTFLVFSLVPALKVFNCV